MRGFWPVAPQQQAKSPSAAYSSVAACGVVKATMHGQTYKLPVHTLQTKTPWV